MLTISKPWGLMSNSISYSHVIEIANEAREHVNKNMLSEAGSSYSPKMKLSERIVDYVFCGRAKQEFMEHLYKMSYERARLETDLVGDSTTGVSANKCRTAHYLKSIKNKEQRIERMLSGNSLQFSSELIRNNAFRETFLIYRDSVRRTSVGMALKLQTPSSQISSQSVPVILIPEFDNAGQIQLCNLDDIKKHGGLRCGGTNYDVRFTENNEPIVMRSNDNPQAELIQKRLLNLWAITNVQKRLADFRSRPCKDMILIATPENREDMEILEWIDPSCVRRHRTRDAAAKIFADGIEVVDDDLDHCSRIISLELETFATLTNPSWDDKKAFLNLQKKITILEYRKAMASMSIREFNSQSMAFWSLVKSNQQQAILEANTNFVQQFADEPIQLDRDIKLDAPS